jgi:hypothetical protein
MNRKIYILLTVLLAWSFNLKAQTAQIGSQTAIPGASVSFDINVADLPANVGAVSLFIGYDPNVLTFTGSVEGTLSGYILNNMMGTNQIGIQWTDPSGADINGMLLTLNFQYSALGGSCNVTFNPGCEFADILLNSITVGYTNGDIGPGPGIATVIIDEVLANAGPVFVGITGDGFTANGGAVTLYIDFDPSVLQFSGYTSTLPLVMISGNNTTGRISVAYSSTTGTPLNTTFLTLNFVYNATGSSELVFTDGCEITYTDLTPEVVSFDNGKVDPLSTAYQLTIDDEIANPGNTTGVGITASGYPVNVGAVTLFIGFNPAHLTFLNLSPGSIVGANANVVSPGLLGITWTSTGGQDIDGIIFTMNFDYHFGSSAITFEGGCDISDITLTEIPTTYNDGSIAPFVNGPEVTLPVKTGTVGQTIDFPISAKNFTMDIAAISMYVGFNNSVLTYTGHTPGTITGYFINYMPVTHQIGIQWSTYPGININPNNPSDDILLTLHFTYNGGACDLTFDAGCEFAEPDLTTAPVSFYDGAVITGSRFAIKAFLEGPFNGSTMNVTLEDSLYLPLTQPYGGAPWNYSGTENVTAIPNANVVDWVMLEIRETTGAASTATSDSTVAKVAAFILNDGRIVGLDGSSEVLIPMTFTDNIYVVVYHRNHLSMMSSAAIPFVNDMYSYDFTSAQSQAYLNGQKALTGGFGMYAGDGNGDGQISNPDLFFIWMAQVGQHGYYGGDFDLNTIVQNVDLFFYWMANVPHGTQVP